MLAPACLLLLWSAPFLLGNELAAQARKPESAAAALRAYERDKSEPEERRARSVRNLGPFETEEVLQALLETWTTAKTVDLKLAALQALAEKRREGNSGLFAEVLGSATDYRLRDAAALGLARFGDLGVTILAERLKELESKRSEPTTRTQRLSLISGLGAAKTEQSVALLAKIALDDKDTERLDALRHLADSPDAGSVAEARLRALLPTSPPLVAAEALRQLALHRAPQTKTAALDLSKRLPVRTLASLHAVLVDVLASVLDTECYEPFLAHAGSIEGDLDERHKAAIEKVRSQPGFVAYLIRDGLALRNPAARNAAVHVLRGVKDDSAGKALIAAARGDESEVASAAIAALGGRGDAAAIPVLREIVATGAEARRADAMLALHKLAANAPETQRLFEAQLTQPMPLVRTLGLDLLAEMKAESALPTAYRFLDDKLWTVRAAAYAFCRKVRSTTSIPLLIPRLDKEKGRLKDDVLDALEALTGMRYGDSARWLKWWEENGKGLTLPALEPQKGAPKPVKAGSATVSTYYDIPFTSMNAAFVIDTSGSMAARIGTGNQTRLDESKRQLERIVNAMAETTRFNLLFFSSTVQEMDKRIGPADKRRKELAFATVKKLEARGGTNIFDALERAFSDLEIDTIYFLSDGDPSAGRVQDPEAILAEVQKWNRTRRIVIHAISVGNDSKLLKRLAALSGGEYRYVR